MNMILEAIVISAIIFGSFAALWIVIYTSVREAMKSAIQEYWPDEDENTGTEQDTKQE